MNQKQAEMFEYYYSQGTDRSMGRVAEKFGVSERTVRRYASQFGWTSLVEERERAVSSAIKEAGDEGAIVSALEAQKMTSAFLREAHRLFLANEISIKSIADIEKVFKLHFDAMKLENQEGLGDSDNFVSLADTLKVSWDEITDPDEEKDITH